MDKIEKLQKMIDEANNIVFFGGAGVSTESGIKDFRSIDGLYNENYKYPPEVILSHSFFLNNPEEFYKFYKDKLNCLNALPNVTHKYLKHLENNGKKITIVTQNIDGLHEKAGSNNVLLLHGSIYHNHCLKCGKSYDAKYVFESKNIPKCSCGEIIKPNVVLYEEQLDENTIYKAIKAIKKCDLLIVAGTSLVVFPAASFINYYQGDKLVVINKDEIKINKNANLVIQNTLGNVFKNLK